MSNLSDLLNEVEVSETEQRNIRNSTNDLYGLYALMDACGNSVHCLIKLLKVELEGRNRNSFLTRIYGRYRKVLPNSDWDIIREWRKEYEFRSRETN